MSVRVVAKAKFAVTSKPFGDVDSSLQAGITYWIEACANIGHTNPKFRNPRTYVTDTSRCLTQTGIRWTDQYGIFGSIRF